MGDWCMGRDGDPLTVLDAELAEAEANAIEVDFAQRLAKVYAYSAMLLGAAQDDPELRHEVDPALLDKLDEQIAQLEALREVI
jgi:hypothetical protein